MEDDIGVFGLLKNDEDKKIARKRVKMRLSGKKVTPEFHYVDISNKEGRTIPCEVSDVIIQYDGRPANLVSFRYISERKQAELDLKERQAELDLKNQALEEMNAALRFLLRKRDEDKIDLEQDVLSNIQKLVMPYLDKLTTSKLDAKLTSYVSILKSNLNDIVSPFSRRVSPANLMLTRAEIQISNLIKQGMDTKEIAELLNLSITTIETHRRNIRKKFGLENRRQNLRTHLSELSNK
jgi:DNA-binding CsgD family transcriptional regulator